MRKLATAILLILIIVVIAIVLTRCSGSTAVVVSPTVEEPTETLVPPTSTNTSTPTEEPTPTATSTPDPTPTSTLTATPELWGPQEASMLMWDECKVIDIDHSDIEEYGGELLDRSGLKVDSVTHQWLLQPMIMYGDQKICVVVMYDPKGQNGMLIYETEDGEVKVLHTLPLR